MLVLARKREEGIRIRTADAVINVLVLEVRHDGVVRLGFEAPSEVEIDRQEVAEKVEQFGRRKRAGE